MGSGRTGAALRRRTGVALAVWAVAFGILAAVAAIPEGPTAALSVDNAYPSVGTAVHFNASASTGHDQGNGRIVAYRFAYGDGADTVWQASSLAVHAYAAAGTYTATVAVIDLRNQTGTASAVVHVGESPPTSHPDIVPVAIQVVPARPHVNDAVNVTVVILNRGSANATSATVDGYDVRPDGSIEFLGSVPTSAGLAPTQTGTLRLPSFIPQGPGNYTIRAIVNNVTPSTPGAPVRSLDVVLEVLPEGTPPGPGPQGSPALDMGPLAVGLSVAAVASMAAAGYFLLRRPPKGPLEPPPHQPPDRSPPPIWPP